MSVCVYIYKLVFTSLPVLWIEVHVVAADGPVGPPVAGPQHVGGVAVERRGRIRLLQQDEQSPADADEVPGRRPLGLQDVQADVALGHVDVGVEDGVRGRHSGRRVRVCLGDGHLEDKTSAFVRRAFWPLDLAAPDTERDTLGCQGEAGVLRAPGTGRLSGQPDVADRHERCSLLETGKEGAASPPTGSNMVWRL